MNPIVSIYGPAINVHFWSNLYERLCKNSISFELVFCGPETPPSNFPSNFRYIQADVKPAQCAEIARRHCQGEFLMVSGDDVFPNEGFLDNMYKTHLAAGNENCVVSCRLRSRPGRKKSKSPINRLSTSYRFFFKQKQSPYLALCPFIKKTIVDEIQGIDRNFIALCWDADITLRVVERGGFVRFCEEAHIYELHKPANRLSLRHAAQDKETLDKMWCMDHETAKTKSPTLFHPAVYNGHMVSKHRLRAVDPFSDELIMEKSQGIVHSDWR